MFKNESFITFHFLCFSCVIVKTIYSSYKTKFHAFVYFPVIIILVIINWQRLYCVVPENIHTPPPAHHGRHFCLRPSSPLEFPCLGVLVIPPSSPWKFRNYSTWLASLWKEYLCQKRCCTILLCER